VCAWVEGDAPAIPEQEPHPGGPQDRRQLRVGGERLQQRHVPDVVDHDDRAAAAVVLRVQGEGGGHPREGPLRGLLRQQRHCGALHPRRRYDLAGVRRHDGPQGHRLGRGADRPRRAADRADRGAAGGVRALAAAHRRRGSDAVRHGPQPAGALVQPEAEPGGGQAVREVPRRQHLLRRPLLRPRRR
ncbi:hypothetical protein ACJX0J_023986, partial [Zea mays]